MYTDRKESGRGRLLTLLILIAALLALALSFRLARGRAGGGDDAAAAIREAVQRGALQCYAVEGVYPPDLKYLEENYGLQVNTRDYYVTYEAFASNLAPSIRVTPRGAQG